MSSGRIRFPDLVRGVIAGIPDTRATLSGAVDMLRARWGKRWSIGALLEAQARRHADRPAVLFGDRKWTYAQLNAWANRLARVLARQGIGPGDCVALLMENHPAVLALVAALAKLGAIAGMLNPNQRGDVLRHSLRAMRPKRVIVAGECLAAWQELGEPQAPLWLPGHAKEPPPAGWLDLDAAAKKAPAGNPDSTRQVQIGQPCYFILTSGTSGLPKASVMTHRRWLNSMAGMGRVALHLTPEDVLYCALPLYHNNGLTVSWGAAMGAGAALALDRKFSASRFWDRARHYRATAFTYIGELCRYLLAQPPSARDREHTVRACIGNGLRPEIWSEFKQRFGIARVCEFYAASEANIAFVNAFNADATAGFCPMSFAVVRCDPDTAQPLRGPDGWLEKVVAGDVGLLMTEVTDRAPFDGYTDASAGEARLVRAAFAAGDCWFNTGDLVRDQGWRHVAFVDRLGDTFRWKGENVATTEVEAALRACEGVADAAVYGVRVPGHDGRAGMAALQLAEGTVFDGERLAATLSPRLAPYAAPVFVRLVPELATTATFKTLKQDLKREGADPAQVRGPLYVRTQAGSAYEPLDGELWRAIGEGRVKL
ncbi:MAG TPA: long-chain-acyl-CoA synthetase [Candidatus Binatia bacterium]|nr:long-chain-acyl-CoA synthetase [Candidatus Binatia bacterium]